MGLRGEQGSRSLHLTWIFALALAFRLGYLFLADEPLIYAHQQQYLRSALTIVEHPDPWGFVLWSDDWRRWLGSWTLAPLYQLFAAGVFAIFGPHLLPLQLAQCLMDSATAVGVGAIGRRCAGPRGVWAGVAYALYWPAVTLPSGTLTENLHTPLLVAAFVLLLRSASNRQAGLAGFTLGVSALARSVSSAFLPLAAAWHAWNLGWRRGWRPALLIVSFGAAAILPWAARNAFLVGDPVLIDSMGVYNLWDDNSFRGGRSGNQHLFDPPAWVFRDQMPEAERRARATQEAISGTLQNPGLFVRKAWGNLEHFLRPDTLYQLVVVEFPDTALRYTLSLVLDDLLLLIAVPLFLVFLIAGRASPARGLIALWSAYYLLMVVVVFHNEIRYRSAWMPFVFAGAAGGVSVVAAAGERRRSKARFAVVLALLLMAWMLEPLVPPCLLAARAFWQTRDLEAQVASGELAGATARVEQATEGLRRQVRPWLRLGHALVANGHTAEAVTAYRRAQERRPDAWIPTLVLPALLREAGREDEALRALKEAQVFSRGVDPWLALEIAWRELPPPLTDEIPVGRLDYGAARGFYGAGHDGRWTRHRAWLRLRPTTPASAYEVTLAMGSPEPSPLEAPEVTVRLAGAAQTRFTLTRGIRPYTLRVAARPGAALVVEIDAPVWTRLGQPPEQGIRVERMTVAPAR
jgi:tetratricopeptide (TPR) repeat protein